MNMKTRIAKFLITLTSFTMMTTVNAYQGSDCCNPCANYDPCCPSPARSFYGVVDYIYWGVQEDGLRFAQSGFGAGCCEEVSSSCCGDSCGNNSGCSKNHDLSWNSGFKVGAGMANPCCDWEMFVQYTWYRANPTKCVTIGACDLILDDSSADIDPALFGLINNVNSSWNFRFNNIDALVTNEFCVNNCFSFRPSFGLKAAWIRQKQNITAVFGDTVLVPGEPTVGERCQKQDFWGVGPKFAVTANASLFDCFSLYGNLGLSTLWSSYRLNRNDAIFNSTVTPGDTRVSLVCAKDCRHPVQSVLETSLGVRWDTELCCGDYGFYVDLAWEQQVWFNHNQFIHSVVAQNHGDLTLQGVTVGAGFSF